MPAPGQTAPLPNAKVKSMQQALTAYAAATGFSAANPGGVDGIVGLRTVSAVIAMIPLLPHMPDEIRTLAMLGPVVLASPDLLAKAKTFVTNNATTIRDSIIGLAAYQAATGKTPTNATPPGTGILNLNVVSKLPGGGGSSFAIYFLDKHKMVYRVAVPVGLQGLAASYTEVQSTTAKPAGIEVTKTDFLTKTGQWYKTWWGIGSFVAGGSLLIAGAYTIARR